MHMHISPFAVVVWMLFLILLLCMNSTSFPVISLGSCGIPITFVGISIPQNSHFVNRKMKKILPIQEEFLQM